MKRTLILSFFVLCSVVAFARPTRFSFNHPTNETEVGGVKFPPKYTQEEWAARTKFREEYFKRLHEADAEIEKRWFANLTKEQKDALDAEKQKAKKEAEESQARVRRRQWEIEGVTNRMAWVKKEYKEKRRIERIYHPGLKWMDSDIVKETVTIAESGKVKIHFFYTADGKKHRFDPDSIEKEIARRKQNEALNAIIKED